MEEQQYKLLDGKAVSAQIKQEMAEEVARIKATGGKIPHWFPSDQCGSYVYRSPLFRVGNSGWHLGAVEALRDSYSR